MAKSSRVGIEKQLQQQELTKEKTALLSTKRKLLEQQIAAATPVQEPEEMKVCKQCGRMKSMSNFRPYASKSKGIRKSTVGHWTICKDCEKVNRDVNRAFHTPVEQRTEAMCKLLAVASSYYQGLVDKGFEPQGDFARQMLNRPYVLHGNQDGVGLTSLDVMTKQMPGLEVPDHLEGTWGTAAIQDNHTLPPTDSGDNSVKTWTPGKNAAVVRRHQDYKSFEDVERELKDLLSRIESGRFEGDAFDMDDAYTNVWADANKSAFDTEASAELKDLDATVSSVINIKMREE